MMLLLFSPLAVLLGLSSLQAVRALPPRGPALPTITLSPYQAAHRANVTELLQSHLASANPSYLSSPEQVQVHDKRQSAFIGTGLCATAMQGFTCGPGNHESNRCAGGNDDWSYCICAGSASLPGRDPQGLWLNTAWGPGCYACYDKPRGYEFDGTCNGNGNGGRGQFISEILATLTVTITEWTYSTITPGGGHQTPPPCYNNDCHDDGGNPAPTNPAATVTRIVTVTDVSSTSRRRASSAYAGRSLDGTMLLAGCLLVGNSLIL